MTKQKPSTADFDRDQAQHPDDYNPLYDMPPPDGTWQRALPSYDQMEPWLQAALKPFVGMLAYDRPAPTKDQPMSRAKKPKPNKKGSGKKPKPGK